jgi:hypothetical protein
MGHILLAATLTASVSADGKSGVPANLKPGAFQSIVEMMWQASPTFKRQCLRIAAQKTLTVRLRAESNRGPGSPRARTEFSRRDGVLTRADVVVSDLRDRVELIGHEFEHIIEQIEGVRLRETACVGTNTVTSVFESCRAMEIGRRIAREIEESAKTRTHREGRYQCVKGELYES